MIKTLLFWLALILPTSAAEFNLRDVERGWAFIVEARRVAATVERFCPDVGSTLTAGELNYIERMDAESNDMARIRALFKEDGDRACAIAFERFGPFGTMLPVLKHGGVGVLVARRPIPATSFEDDFRR